MDSWLGTASMSWFVDWLGVLGSSRVAAANLACLFFALRSWKMLDPTCCKARKHCQCLPANLLVVFVTMWFSIVLSLGPR